MPLIRDAVGHELTVDEDALPYFPGYEVVEDEKPEKLKPVPAEKNKE